VLPAAFNQLETTALAKLLIGKSLFRKIGKTTLSGRIVETEAYLPSGDSACHAAAKRTPRNEVMFSFGGVAYVYAIHAKHCFNIVSESEGLGCAVLIRAAEPISGIEEMKANRETDSIYNLLSGPGKLCQAMKIDRSLNGKDLSKPNGVWIEDDGSKVDASRIKVTNRIGVTSAAELPLRFVLANSEFASGPKYMR